MSFVGCQDNSSSDSDYDYDYDYDYSYTMTKSEAISIAKESSTVQNKIAAAYGMKFFYTPDWGTVTATEYSGGSWEVVLKGTISGYTDDYKTDFEYDKKFTAKVTVGSSGYVGYVYVTKN
jgi:roadblock/LC7 domain-containing protein